MSCTRRKSPVCIPPAKLSALLVVLMFLVPARGDTSALDPASAIVGFPWAAQSLGARAQPPPVILIDPKATYLLTNGDPNARDTVPIDLTGLGIAEGDLINVEQLGGFSFAGTFPPPLPDNGKATIAVFSSSDELLSSSQRYRVPGAIPASINPITTIDTLVGGLATDIPEDFFINNNFPQPIDAPPEQTPNAALVLQVPVGGRFLFVGSNDRLFGDNTDTDGDYALRITRQPTAAELSFSPPSGISLEPPSDLRARVVSVGGPGAAGKVGDEGPAAASRPADVFLYKVYRSSEPNVAPTPENFLTSLPPGQTMVTVAVAPGGSFFVITAVYPEGESGASNEAGAGQPGALLRKLRVKASGISATGTDFTDTVQVFVDGIPFTNAAKVKRNRTKVAQKGTLLTGQTILAYKPSGSVIEVTFLNNDGRLTRKSAMIP
jgi:hypothetical protein